MSEYTVSGSVVVYNKPEDAVRTVDSIIRNTPPSFRLFVIDNDSAEKISATLRERFGDGEGRIEYIDSPRNVGFGAGHNMTLDRLESRYHFVINPDILINEDTIGNMCRFMDRHPEVAIACPKVLNPDGTVQYIAKNRPGLLSLVKDRQEVESHGVGFFKPWMYIGAVGAPVYLIPRVHVTSKRYMYSLLWAIFVALYFAP